MKKLFLVLLFFSLTFSAFSQYTQIGSRLRYEKDSGRILITDVFDKKSIRFYLERAMNNTFHIYNYYTQIGTINIYYDDFTSFITKFITSWSSSHGGYVEWQQYASQIADRVVNDFKEMYPYVEEPGRSPPHPGGKVPQPTGIQTINQFQPGMNYVQIGAYSNAATANSEIAEVDSSLPRAIMQVTLDIRGMNTNVNRVLIGPLDRAQSVSVLQRYRTIYEDAFIQFRK